MWHMTCDRWHVAHDTWHATCDTWHVRGGEASLALTVW